MEAAKLAVTQTTETMMPDPDHNAEAPEADDAVEEESGAGYGNNAGVQGDEDGAEE